MRILYCNKYNFPFSGTEVYLFELMELMRARGHTVALFAMEDERGQPTRYDRHFVPKVDFKGRKPGLSQLFGQAARAIYSGEARARIRRMIQDFRPDVAHVRNIYHHLSPSIFWELKTQTVPVLYHLNDFKMICPSYNMVSHGKSCEKCQGGKFWNVVTERCYDGPTGSSWILAAEAYTHRWLRTYEKCVDRFLAPSQFVKDKLTQNGWTEKLIDVLPHFQHIPEALEPNREAAAPILYFGRLSPEKGVSDLLHAVHQLPEIPLIIAGEGPERLALETLAGDLRMRNVTFTGHLDRIQLRKLIASSRFTVLPSRAYETMGKSILESFASARTVVATDLGSRRELVEDGKTGLLFRAGDTKHLAVVISRLYDSPDVASTMGNAGREFVRQRHSQESHYLKLIEIYADLARQKPVATTKQRLRVAFIGGRGVISKYSGIETYYEETGKHLTSLGHEVTAYCRSYFTSAVPNHNGIRVIRLPTLRTKHLETLLHTLFSTAHVVFSDCQIVHYHALGPALFSFFPRLVGKKTLVTIQGLDWQRKKWGWLASRILQLGEKAALRFPNTTVVVSHTLQDRFLKQSERSISYIPNGTSIRERSITGRLDGWGLKSGEYILFLGRFSPEKNCHLLIDAYEKLETSAKLVLAGGSSHTDSYARNLRKRATDQILVLDWVARDALDELLTNACLFVLPSSIEGLSLALLDAMGAGVCVLASDIPENRELVDESGYTFKSGDVKDLERMLRMLVAGPELRESAAKKALEKIRQDYLWPKISAQVEQMYFDVTGITRATGIKKSPSPTGPEKNSERARLA